MTTVTTQQKCVAVIHSYARPTPHPHTHAMRIVSRTVELNNDTPTYICKKYNPQPYRFWKAALNLPSLFTKLANAWSIMTDGVDDFINCGNHASLWSQAKDKFSFSFWWYQITLAQGTGTDRWPLDHGSSNIHSIRVLDASTNSDIIFNIKNAAGTNIQARGQPNVKGAGVWRHILCTYDNSLGNQNMKLFVNNILTGTADLTETINLSQSLSLGGSVSANAANAIFKDFRWWNNKALTSTEITDVYDNDLNAPKPDYWLRMQEGTGVAKDTISNGSKTATLTNGALWKHSSQLQDWILQWDLSDLLELVDTVGTKVFKAVTETLNLTDLATATKIIKRSVSESLDLTDAEQKFSHINTSESLNLVDTQNKFIHKFTSETLNFVDTTTKLIRRTVNESLSLTETEMKHANKFISEILDVVDAASRIFIPGAGGQLFQRAVNETLDLVDSAIRNFIGVALPSIPGGKYLQPIATRTKIPSRPMEKPNFIYRINIFETLDLRDKVNAIAIHYNYIPQLIYQSTIQEYLTFIDKVTVNVVRKGRFKILQQIKNVLETLDILDSNIGQAENNPIAIAAELENININLTKTNREAKLVQEELAKKLERKLNVILRDYKLAKGFMSLDTIKMNNEAEIKSMIRKAIQKNYILAINYVEKALKSNEVYLSGRDVELIKSETNRISDMFWRNTFTFLKQWQLNEHLKLMPIGIAFDFSIDGIVKLISGIATTSILGKATQTKVQELPPEPAEIDLETGIATMGPKRVLVFATEKDSKVCPICQHYEGVEYFEDDPFIVRPIEDTHIGCRCRLLIKVDDGLVSG